MRRLLLLVLAVMFAASAPAAVPSAVPRVPAAETGRYDRIHTVAVISAIGDGMTAVSLSHRLLNLDISNWRVDEAVNATLRRYLSGRFSFVEASFDKRTLLAIPEGAPRKAATRDFLKSLPADGVDAFVLVRPAAGQALPGFVLGYYYKSYPRHMALFVDFDIEIVDAHSFAVLGKAHSRMVSYEGAEPRFAERPLDTEFFVDDSLVLWNQRQDVVRRALEDFLPPVLVETLRALQLGVTLPPVGDHSIVPQPQADRVANIRSLAVVSVIGDGFTVVTPGGRKDQAGEERVPAPDWRLDDEAEALARTVLAKKYAVKSVPVDRTALAGMSAAVDVPSVPGLTATTDVDAYVVLLRASREDGSSGGINVERRSSLFEHGAVIYADYAIALVDARTLKPISVYFGTMSPASGRADPAKTVRGARWKTKPLPPGVAAEVHAAASELLADSIPETLYRMGLTREDVPENPAQ